MPHSVLSLYHSYIIGFFKLFLLKFYFVYLFGDILRARHNAYFMLSDQCVYGLNE